MSKSINLLTKRALKNKPKLKPQKGCKHLEDIDIGDSFSTPNGINGILIDKTPSAAYVIITSYQMGKIEKDDNYYTGKSHIALKTEILIKR